MNTFVYFLNGYYFCVYTAYSLYLHEKRPFVHLSTLIICIACPSSEAGYLDLFVKGKYNVKVDGKAFPGYPKRITVPAGKHKVNLKVFCQDRVPAIFVRGKNVVSDATWLVTFEDKEWIDETGKTSDQSDTIWLKADTWNFNDPQLPPSTFKLTTKEVEAVTVDKKPGSLLLDFGKETFGFIKLKGLSGKGNVNMYYGVSPEEARDTAHAETTDFLQINQTQKRDSVMELTKAFRYVNVQFDGSVSLDGVSMLYEQT